MDLSAPHVGFVIASYAISAAVLLALIVGEWRRLRRVSRHIEELEGAGAPRRRHTDRETAP